MMETSPSESRIIADIARCQRQTWPLLLQSDALRKQGDLPRAERAYRRLIDLLREQMALVELNNARFPERSFELVPVVESLVNALMTQADLLEALGRRESAEAGREEAISLAADYLPPGKRSERLRQRAEGMLAQGRFNEALVSLLAAREAVSPAEEPHTFAALGASLAGIYEWLGDYERARAESAATRKTLVARGEWNLQQPGNLLTHLFGGALGQGETQARLYQIQMSLLQTEARSNRYLGNYQEAEHLFRQVYEHTEPWVRPAIDFQFAAILIESGRFQEGLAALASLEPTFSGLIRPKLGVLYKLRGEALLGLGHPQQALPVLEAAVAELREHRDTDSLWRALWVRARALFAVGHEVPALAAYQQMADVVDTLHRAPLGYRLDSTYLREKLPAMTEAIALARDHGEADLCCRLIELVKSRILTSVLTIPPAGADDQSDRLAQKLDRLDQTINALDYQLFVGEADESAIHRRATLQQERASLLEQRRYADPRWRALSEPVPFDVASLLHHLAGADTAALSLFFGPEEITSVLLHDGHIRLGSVSVSGPLREGIAAYKANLEARNPRPELYDLAATTGLAATDLVPETLLEAAVTADRLLLAPHGTLHLLPWASLPFRDRRLFQLCAVGIVPNLRVISALTAQPSAGVAPHVALIGAPDYSGLPLAPLDNAVEELFELEACYDTRIIDRLYMEEEATEANFWHLATHQSAPGNILHVACHGTLNRDDPLDAALQVADGRIDAAEVARRRLAYQEVVLSACSTGYRPTDVGGVSLTGDEILGLPAAFLEAGVRSVLVSIPWARDDAAMTFMRLYHRAREGGETPLIALQQTQIRMLEYGTYPPYLWVGFTVYGCI